MSHTGSCHCGALTVTIKDEPVEASQCNCSICRQTGSLWIHAPPAFVAVIGEGISYVHSDNMLTLFHCSTCGVITYWRSVDPDYNRMAINLRLFDLKLSETLPRRHVGGASW